MSLFFLNVRFSKKTGSEAKHVFSNSQSFQQQTLCLYIYFCSLQTIIRTFNILLIHPLLQINTHVIVDTELCFSSLGTNLVRYMFHNFGYYICIVKNKM